MDKLKRERTPLRNTITRTTNEIKSGLSLEELDIILIRAKFERLTILNDRLILIDDKIKEILLDDPRSTEAQINDEMEQCETYSLQVGIVAQKVKEYESKLAAPCDDKMSQSSTSDVKRQIKLPKFELKKYTGELEEWLSWWSHFEKIHLDESLSDVDKFEYLIQSMVVGSKAHRLVTSFPLTQKNYNKVIEDLKDRFGDRDMLTELYVRKLLKLVIASARSEKRTLAQLYDDLVAHLHSLGSLGVDTKSGGGAFLYPLVESSLPLELIKIWQRSRTPFKERDYSEIEVGIEHSGAKSFDKLEGLLEFLKQEVKNAERISFVAEGFEPSLPFKQGKRENNPPKIHTASALFVGKTNLLCLFYDKDNHLSQNCFKAAKMLESDRLKRVQDAKVCFKCLRKNHLKKKDCRSSVRCKRCQGPHFEIIQKSYIRRSLAKELDLPKVGEVNLNKFLFGGQTTGEKAHSIFYFQLDNVDERKAFKMEALEETICGNISPVETGPRQWELDKKGITLSKVDNNKTEIDILIGGDYYGQLLTGKIEQLAGGLTAIQTVLETIGIRDPTEVISDKEKNVLMQEKFREKICRGHDGRYLVSLPWKEGIGTIPNNLEIAKRRLEAMTQKLTQKGQFVPYDEVFRSWFRENLIEEVDGEDIKPIGHYLPHRPIYKVQSETTPIRPVYDASCKASKRSLSLNECLETGPNLIELLPEILIRFREKKIGDIADIRKAFQTIGIDEKERDYLRFLWWDEQDPSKIRTLRHTRVVFGLTCSPFILAAVLKYHLESIVDYRKPVADVLKRSFYVDNLVFSVDEPDELERIREVAKDIMDKAKMTLREWEYGGSKILENEEDSRIPQDTTKYGKVTKRTLLSNLQKFFDPLGFYAPQFILSKWWEGPQWLRESEDKWSKQKPIPNEEQVLEEKKGTVVQNTIVQNRKFWYISKFSSYKANLRVLAWVLRFIKILKREEIQGKTLSTHEVVQAEKVLIRLIQRDSLGKGQISHLKTKVRSDGLIDAAKHKKSDARSTDPPGTGAGLVTTEPFPNELQKSAFGVLSKKLKACDLYTEKLREDYEKKLKAASAAIPVPAAISAPAAKPAAKSTLIAPSVTKTTPPVNVSAKLTKPSRPSYAQTPRNSANHVKLASDDLSFKDLRARIAQTPSLKNLDVAAVTGGDKKLVLHFTNPSEKRGLLTTSRPPILAALKFKRTQHSSPGLLSSVFLERKPRSSLRLTSGAIPL
ncbi:hypothetical protein LAZ67_7000910 [Cordylochernes scorpioides]|uniref:Reverse transcriptase domain-containing protein n=1 Tax=Cordylochernes scorpioides TaxID=51811 RepID=A0ABY6KM82_9ARAC|nr:hypothetical protein LAZ67_7000910 [Cordylochernes scorpioides]